MKGTLSVMTGCLYEINVLLPVHGALHGVFFYLFHPGQYL